MSTSMLANMLATSSTTMSATMSTFILASIWTHLIWIFICGLPWVVPKRWTLSPILSCSPRTGAENLKNLFWFELVCSQLVIWSPLCLLVSESLKFSWTMMEIIDRYVLCFQSFFAPKNLLFWHKKCRRFSAQQKISFCSSSTYSTSSSTTIS